MLIKILIGLVVIVMVFVAIVALRPSEFRVERSAVVSAPPAVVFAQVNDLHKWEGWSPWVRLDPAARLGYDGPPAGAGAGFAWAGNYQVGEGHMTITESRPNELIRLRLEFLKPFAGTNTAEFAFSPQGEQTLGTWTMFGRQHFMSRAIGMFMSMDTMIGGMFEKGLAQMKSIAEAAAVT
ncbi:MAG TPA: SRPBCC family protein [Candidatus Acidoferrales bacterium]|nr:SRPBCC family protein [Candidatus Acidoferrales bacterium]